jgi:hypothetical protein
MLRGKRVWLALAVVTVLAYYLVIQQSCGYSG